MPVKPYIVPDGTIPEPWDRQPGEGDGAWRWFCAYRELPPDQRSVRAAGAVLEKRSHRRAEVWSARNNWMERARAWDNHVDKQAQTVLLDDIVANKRRSLEKLEGIGQYISRELAAHMRQSKQADENTPGRDTPLASLSEVRKLLEMYIRNTRLILGQPTEHTASSEEYDPSKLSTEELRVLRRLREKAKG